MDICRCNYNPNIQFGAHFLNSEDLHKIVDYSIKNGTYLKLENAARNIETSMLKTRIFVELGTFNNRPTVTFKRYDPKAKVAFPVYLDRDYTMRKSVTYVSNKKEKNPLEFAYSIIERMGRDVPKNRLFRQAIASRPEKRHYLYLIT